MSQHHKSSRHNSATYHLRPEYEARLPLPCTECGRPVERTQKWHVAHIIPASEGGRTTRQNTGVAHALCNLRAGGKLATRKQAAARNRSKGIRKW